VVEAISDEELEAFMQAMKNRYGLDFTNYEKKSLKRGIVRLMMKHKLTSMLELWTRVLRDKEFFMSGIDDLLVNLTELFRNPDAWVKVRDEILNKFAHKPEIKIWHAGCSTGEEVYTMGIVLEEKHMLNKAKLIATDLSSIALSKAIAGKYSLMILKQYLKPFLEIYPNKKMEDFFDFQERDAVIKDKYQHNVSFQKHNLVHDPMKEKYDIIFCRNVMIYFDENLKIHVLNLFNNCLNEGGYLIIGYYDIMPDEGKLIFDTYDVKTRIYQKKKN
jgi:chemotaxis protein methyltransferase CheR